MQTHPRFLVFREISRPLHYREVRQSDINHPFFGQQLSYKVRQDIFRQQYIEERQHNFQVAEERRRQQQLLGDRFTLRRVAQAAQKVWLAILSEAHTRKVAQLHHSFRELHFVYAAPDYVSNSSAAEATGNIFAPTTDLGDTGRKLRDAMLAHEMCTYSCLCMRTYLENLLEEECQKLEIFCVLPKNPTLELKAYRQCPECIFPTPYSKDPSPNSQVHQGFVVTMKSGSKWAIDLTCSQYGFSEPLMLWDEYIEQRANSHCWDISLHDFETWYLPLLLEIEMQELGAVFRSYQEWELSQYLQRLFCRRDNEHHIGNLNDEIAGFFNNIHFGSQVQFENSLEDHVANVKCRVRAYVYETMFTPQMQHRRLLHFV
jgi:hypothetical protein